MGAALDWAVAKCENPDTSIEHFIAMHSHYAYYHGTFDYSTNWAQGGPIIELEKIGVVYYVLPQTAPTWIAGISGTVGFLRGPTPLIAAMRAFVASKLGDEVEIPEELLP